MNYLVNIPTTRYSINLGLRAILTIYLGDAQFHRGVNNIFLENVNQTHGSININSPYIGDGVIQELIELNIKVILKKKIETNRLINKNRKILS